MTHVSSGLEFLKESGSFIFSIHIWRLPESGRVSSFSDQNWMSNRSEKSWQWTNWLLQKQTWRLSWCQQEGLSPISFFYGQMFNRKWTFFSFSQETANRQWSNSFMVEEPKAARTKSKPTCRNLISCHHVPEIPGMKSLTLPGFYPTGKAQLSWWHNKALQDWPNEVLPMFISLIIGLNWGWLCNKWTKKWGQ